MQGYIRRNRARQGLLAWHASHVMAPHLKKKDRLSPAALMGGEQAEAKRKKRRRKKRNQDDGA